MPILQSHERQTVENSQSNFTVPGALLFFLGGLQIGRQPRLQPCRAVRMNDSLRSRAIELCDSHAKFGFSLVQFSARRRLVYFANFRPQFALHRTVSSTTLEILAMTLSGTGDIWHDGRFG